MNYPNVVRAFFMIRENRFVARCRLVTGEEVVVHVKNTGRGKEVLIKGAPVVLQYWDNPKRKTKYDLIAVKKQDQWINIDSQVPNQLAYEGILDGQIQLPDLQGEIVLLRREVVYGQSKFDFYLETDQGEMGFVEVKGMTLENNRVGAFPDAPTIRGLKHVNELMQAKQAGYYAAVLFMIQFEAVDVATIHRDMQPALAAVITQAQSEGVAVLAYNCHVQEGEIKLLSQIPFDVDAPFIDPNIDEGKKALL
ncbi:sugar fermentation stimulation protein [Enterococcus sp. 8G7_MSG3316]|uniref:Sugar fermentation stimulation protein homolog n=1 Tax=Candidatus Enterococcus testudinis TaxID=1834191 RepID=A0A242A8E5_9ENTE|nr:DNA/RNA nuclease SfsA [Enterococcus sp. 8G7_MSG3316]OTN77001.1 sugar fermentation stimulation protein [Enterococcus sp. 8G7_MSG3316]